MSSEVIVEQGIVKSVGQGIVRAEIARPSCEKAATCTMCSCGAGGRMTVEVETDLELKEGQEVTLRIEQPSILSAVFFVFLLPAVALLAGIGIGQAVSGLWGVLLGVAIPALSLILIVLYDRHLRATRKATVRILTDGEQR